VFIDTTDTIIKAVTNTEHCSRISSIAVNR